MDRRRIILALAVALALATGFSYFMYSRIRAASAAKPQTVKVVAAAKALSAGAPLAGDSLVLIDWPVNLKLIGSFAKPEDVLGRSLIYPVAENQPILEHDLAMAGSGIGLTVKIPEGMRAVSVRSNEVVGVAGFLYPGSHVDVLVTYRPLNSNDQVTQTVLQNVEVLTAGQRIQPDPNGKPETVNVVTLLLKPDDGAKLVLASTNGTIQFVLRNGADQNIVVSKPVTGSDFMSGAKKPETAAPPATRVAKAVKPPDFYEVETITTGGKRSTDKFSEKN